MQKLLYFAAAFGFRFALFVTGFSPLFQQRVEVSTPLNSWVKVKEGLFLQEHGVNPYEGDTYHATPLDLWLSSCLSMLPPEFTFTIFVLCDLVTAYLLAWAVDEILKFYLRKSQETSSYVKDSPELSVCNADEYMDGVLAAYLFSPFTIVNCVGQTLTVFANLTLALCILCMLKGQRYLMGLFLAFAAYHSLYPVNLVLPGIICVYNKEVAFARERKQRVPSRTSSFLKSILAFVIPLTALLVASRHSSFFDRTYGFILNVRDLKPNIGLFWYFFTEMFDHFHLLFICTFQINAFIYVIPLTIRFFNEPAMLIYSFCALSAIFKSYPSVGDVGFYLSLLPMWRHLFPFMQQKFLVACFFAATTALAPVQWLLWIYSGSANANFYFGVTIGFGTAQIFLLTDIMLAYLKREYYLKHGMKKVIDGEDAGLSLR